MFLFTWTFPEFHSDDVAFSREVATLVEVIAIPQRHVTSGVVSVKADEADDSLLPPER